MDSECALVLLSGGLDSTICAAIAARDYSRVHAIGYDYGQPQRDHELVRAAKVADRFGIPYDVHRIMIPSAGLMVERPIEPHQAVVPCRNMIFASLAAAAGVKIFESNFDLIIGCVSDDREAFADCRPEFLAACGASITLALGVHVRVVAPLVDNTKSKVLQMADDLGVIDLAVSSWSCYAPTPKPCAICSACVSRARAFASRPELTDQAQPAQMCGGDPARCASL